MEVKIEKNLLTLKFYQKVIKHRGVSRFMRNNLTFQVLSLKTRAVCIFLVRSEQREGRRFFFFLLPAEVHWQAVKEVCVLCNRPSTRSLENLAHFIKTLLGDSRAPSENTTLVWFMAGLFIFCKFSKQRGTVPSTRVNSAAASFHVKFMMCCGMLRVFSSRNMHKL